MASASNQFTLEVQNDLSACFESVNRQLLWDSAVTLGYPLSILRISLASYAWKRFVSLDGILAGSAHARRGIVAGSQFATSELKCLFLRGLVQVAEDHPNADLDTHVDDFSVIAISKFASDLIRKALLTFFVFCDT